MTTPAIPLKKQEYANRFFDSTVWNDFRYRDDDIVVASYAKAGTTLLQQILAQLIFNGAEDIHLSTISPWMDSVHPDKKTKLDLVESQAHRRILKTHLPVDTLVFSSKAKYIYVGRDARDIVWSLYDHQQAACQDAELRLNANSPSSSRLRVLDPPSSSVVDYFHSWLDRNGHPFWPFWENVRSWWAIGNLPNVLFVHYSNLTGNMAKEIQRIATFIDVPVDAAELQTILRHCSLEYMREYASRYVPHGTGLWRDEGRAFFNKGQSGRWMGILPPDADAKFKQRAVIELGDECARWLTKGVFP